MKRTDTIIDKRNILIDKDYGLDCWYLMKHLDIQNTQKSHTRFTHLLDKYF